MTTDHRLDELEAQEPVEMDVTELMDAPPGTERAGDEFHDPDNWVICRDCGFDNPADYEQCLRCGADLTR